MKRLTLVLINSVKRAYSVLKNASYSSVSDDVNYLIVTAKRNNMLMFILEIIFTL